MSEKKSNHPRKRNWSCILYPESMPDDWKVIVEGSGLPFAMSPLHDSDLNPDGEPKKPHYHCLFCYSGPTSYSIAERFSKSLGGTIPQAIESVRGIYRYFTHQDNPEKFQYNHDDIMCLNGFSILDYADYTKSEVLKAKKDLQLLIIQQDLTEYSDFMEYVLLNCSEFEFDVASGHTMFFNSYLKSRRFRKDNILNRGVIGE